jgi:hypothetical protein
MGVIQDGYYYPKPDEISLNHVANCELGEYSDRAKEMRDALVDGCLRMAVSLLSKEDIESLGWKYINGFYWEWPVKGLECEEISNRSLDWRLNWVNPQKSLKLMCYERNSFEWEVVYAGPCPTINELRYLMNLLRIVPGNLQASGRTSD